MDKNQKCDHKWGEVKAIKEGKRCATIEKTEYIRTCEKCGHKDKYEKGPERFGWHSCTQPVNSQEPQEDAAL